MKTATPFLPVLLAFSVACGAETVVRVTDINPGAAGSYPSWLTLFQGKLYFRANDGLRNVELWRFDGTNASLAADIVPGPTGSSPSTLTDLNGVLYFNASVAGAYRLWKFDGTNASAVPNLNPPYAFFDSGRWKPVTWNGSLWYASGGKVNLFSGTQFSYLNTPPWAQMDLVLYNNAIYYGAQDEFGVELWRFGGTANRVSDINPGNASANPEELFVVGSKLYFRARDDAHGNELWCYDGVSSRLVADIFPGGNPPYFNSSNPSGFALYRNTLYFSADDGVHGYELFQYDGTNVTLAADVNPNPVYSEGGDPMSDSYPRQLTVWNNALYFIANNQQYGGLWRYDGTNAVLLGGGAVQSINELIVYGGGLYFDADDGVYGRELWRIESNPKPRLSLSAPAGTARILLAEAETGLFVIEATENLATWTPVATNRSMDGQVFFNDTIRTNAAQRLFRAVRAGD